MSFNSLLALTRSCAEATEFLSAIPESGARDVHSANVLAELSAATTQLLQAIDALSTRQSPLLHLSREVQIRVLRFCEPDSLAQLACCSKAFHHAARP